MQVSPHNTHFGRRSCFLLVPNGHSRDTFASSQQSRSHHNSHHFLLFDMLMCFHTKFFPLHCATPNTSRSHSRRKQPNIDKPVYNYHNWYHFSLRIILACRCCYLDILLLLHLLVLHCFDGRSCSLVDHP
jgi:hypothetical protein